MDAVEQKHQFDAQLLRANVNAAEFKAMFDKVSKKRCGCQGCKCLQPALVQLRSKAVCSKVDVGEGVFVWVTGEGAFQRRGGCSRAEAAAPCGAQQGTRARSRAASTGGQGGAHLVCVATNCGVGVRFGDAVLACNAGTGRVLVILERNFLQLQGANLA
eukprot:scaffold2783_cov20-Tisochrysis_lutea.AAC.4